MIKIEAGFYTPIKQPGSQYGQTMAFALVVPARTSISNYRVVSGTIERYKDLDDFFFKTARRYRMPASQIARIPLMVELQVSDQGRHHILIYRGARSWRALRQELIQSLESNDTAVFHDFEV